MFIVVFKTFIISTGKTLKSLLNMVDLAGSERQKDAMTTGKILNISYFYIKLSFYKQNKFPTIPFEV